MQTEVPAPSAYIAAKRPSSVWVAHGESVTRVDEPRMIGDTIAGVVDGSTLRLPLSGVRSVAVRQTDWYLTAAAAATSAGLILVVITAIREGPHGGQPPPCVVDPLGGVCRPGCFC